MPKNNKIKSVLIIGAGPIIIGQACEFDYSGVQACKALKEEGIRVILVNSNPATIMTDPDMADKVYIEPIHWRNIEKIIINEKPDAILPTMGGQTALNTTLDLNRHKILQEHNVDIIGASIKSIDMAEDRELFKLAMSEIGLETPRAFIAHNYEEALVKQKDIEFPVIIRPSFTLGGSGGGIAYNIQDFEIIVKRGLDLSPTSEILLEESVIGWKEFEMEVVRDKNDNCIIVCSIENIDPMGVHTGDSITVAPAQTLTDKEYQKLRNASIQVLRKIGVDTGGSNVQFAISPIDGRILVIGFASGEIPKFPVNLALVKEFDVVGVFWGAFTRNNKKDFQENMKELFQWHEKGLIIPKIEEKFSLQNAAKALSKILNRGTKGKVILNP